LDNPKLSIAAGNKRGKVRINTQIIYQGFVERCALPFIWRTVLIDRREVFRAEDAVLAIPILTADELPLFFNYPFFTERAPSGVLSEIQPFR
jgi:hypothetical protein